MLNNNDVLLFREGFTAGFPLVGSTLTLVYYIAFDRSAAIVVWRFPGQEDGLCTLISPFEVLRRIRDSCRRKRKIRKIREIIKYLSQTSREF